MVNVEFVCLAASVRPDGMCYAGKEVTTGRWLRPLGSTVMHCIPHFDKVYSKANPARIGDIIRCRNAGFHPLEWQQENFLKGAERWTKSGTVNYEGAANLIDNPIDLWGSDSSGQGQRDRVSVATAAGFENSLYLVKAKELSIIATRVEQGKLKHRARFLYRGQVHDFSMTDPHMNLSESGTTRIGNALVCCSLPERWVKQDGTVHPYIYKVVAGIITPERLG